MSVERQLMMSSGGVQQYTISNSLRFRSSASAYLNRTLTTPANAYKWTWSGWLKRGVFADVPFFSGYNTGALTRTFISFSSDTILFYQASGSGGSITYPVRFFTTPVYRDPSAWYHIILSYDSTQATSTNRVSFYVNGVQVTNFSVADYPSQNYACDINAATTHTICRDGYNNTNGFDGYLTEINFVDGQALTPSSFGETSSTTGVWIPKKYTGSYGTNGFYLNFNNNTSTTALGYDTSGNGNNWTPNNFSLTTGATYDSMIDSPTSYASGANNVGNYAVLNPLAGTSGTVADGNLGLTTSTSDYSTRISTIGMTTGKWYFEATQLSYSGNNQPAVAIVNSSFVITVDLGTANSWAYYGRDGNKYTSGSGSAYGATYGNNDVIGVAFDADAGTLTFYKNNTSQGTAFTGLTSGPYFFAIGDTQAVSSSVFAVNFGQRPFAYTPPSGYNALNTYNLSTPSIVDGSKQFAASLYTGTGSSLSVSGANFTPDFVWIKSRSAATDHALYDVIRGTQARLESNTTDAEVTSDNGVTAFNSTGFTVGTLAQVNTSSATYVGWQWKANGTAVTNTDGSITSSVSANTTSGFSVVTYTGTGSAATVGHGLGVAPNFIIIKSRNTVTDWPIYSSVLGGTQNLLLDQTSAAQTTAAYWNNTNPTSSVFTVNYAQDCNKSAGTYVAYCFAAIPGYSAFGSYTGNGSSDGPFVYCGFRPRFLLVKRTDTNGYHWFIFDTSRSTYNVITAELYPDSSAAEVNSSNDFDIISNGFKCRFTGASFNASGGTYIYAAFAENPFKYSLAR